jgi:hypothetical protein
LNTRSKFISQSLGVFLVLFAGHVVIVANCFDSPEPEYYEEANVQLGRRFLEATADVVIVGSSMGARVDAGRLPKAFNLSFIGRGAFDGLAIIEHSKSKPAMVLVEVNTLFREEDENFTSKITSPYGRLLNRSSHEMPVNYAVRFAAWAKNQLLGQAAADPPQPFRPEPRTKTPAVAGQQTAPNPDSEGNEVDTQHSEALARVVQQNINDWQTLPEFFHLDDNLDRLAQLANSFADHNIEIVLFELPCHPDIDSSPRLEQIRKGIRNRDVLAQLMVIRAADVTKFQSNDGLHLIRQSSQEFTDLLASKLSNQ